MRSSAILFIVIGSLVLASTEGAPRATETVPLWSADLNSFSYSLRSSARYIGGMPYPGRKSDMGVLFASSGEVVCYYLTRKTGSLVQRTEAKSVDPFQVQLLFFDSGTGKLRVNEQLPARAGDASVMINNAGNIILRAGEFLRLYTSAFDVIKERNLEIKEYQHRSLRISPTGKTLLVVSRQYKPVRTDVELLSAASLDSLGKGQDGALAHRFAVSDESISATDERESKLLFRRFDEPWHALWDGKASSCLPSPTFLTNSQLLVLCSREVMVINKAGQIIMREALQGSKGQHIEELAAVTNDGKFFAVSVEQTKGGFMDYSSIKRGRTRILVYDTGSRKQIASIPVEPVPKKDYDFALAPDGSKLAVMTDDKLRVYAVSSESSLP